MGGFALTAALALGASTTTVEAQAPVGLARFGPPDPVTGYPMYYEDTTGLRLGQCTNPALCFFFPPNPALPVHFPTSATDPASNWPVEFFYFGLKGVLAGTGINRALLTCGLEGSFANGVNVVPGDQTVFSRIRIRATGLVANASYTVTHPYGVETIVANGTGVISLTRDVPLGIPLNFSAALAGDIGPFLTPVGFTAAQRIPGAYISDGATLVNVQGSPRGTNFFRIAGPGAAAAYPANAIAGLVDVVQLDFFTLQGQIAASTGVGVTDAYVAKTPTETTVDVWATSATGATLQATAAGSLPVSLQEVGLSGTYFGRVVLGPAALPTSVTVTNLTDFPPTTATSAALKDLVSISSAIYTPGGDLIVSANSSDKVGNPALTVTGLGFAPKVLTSLGGGNATAGVGLLPGAPTPHTITVTSAEGGSMSTTVAVEILPPPPPPPTPVVANAGPDQSVAAGAAVALSGALSTGPIASYAWTHNAGTAITLLGAATATPSFTAPSLPTATDITLTLTVTSTTGAVSTDLVLVHVAAVVVTTDNVTIAAGPRYIVNKNSWRVNGTATPAGGQTITVYLGLPGDTARPIGTATVGATGAWAVNTVQGTGPAPTATDTTIWARSSRGGQSVAVTFARG